MTHNYGIYSQGAMFTYEDFDPAKTVSNFCKIYEISLTYTQIREIANDSVSKETFEYLCRMFDVSPKNDTLQALCVEILNPYEMERLFEDGEEMQIGNEMVTAMRYTDIEGEFFYDNLLRTSESVSDECMILCFEIPFVWNIRDAVIPVVRKNAVFQLELAAKSFLKDDIDWDKRLGSLVASIFCS